MIINEMSIQNLSVALVHYVYRNTVIEDYHSESVTMDANLYKIIHRIVAKNLSYVKQFYTILKDIATLEEFSTVAKTTMTPYKAKEFALFSQSLWFLKNSNCGWDPAKEVELINWKRSSDFLLGGVFKRFCEEHVQLDDAAMCQINKDINNRMYTLLLHHYFDKNGCCMDRIL